MVELPESLIAELVARGDWTAETISDVVREHAAVRPHGVAFAVADAHITWRDYDLRADRLAGAVALQSQPGDLVGVFLPDGIDVHIAFLAIERAGRTIVGVGPRAGDREIDHLLRSTAVTAVVTDRSDVAQRIGVAPIDPRAGDTTDGNLRAGHTSTSSTDLWLCNSTSGTTGLPKVVMHNQARWFFFHRLAMGNAPLRQDDVFLCAIPAPFGFGLWSSHFTPTILGASCVILPRWSAGACLDALEQHRVSVMACVSSQLSMLLADPSFERRDLSRLRIMYTGGEMVPYERAREFEERTGCVILQFYGSNETGALSATAYDDDADHRLRTAGRVIPEMDVRLYDSAGNQVGSRGRGVAACRGGTNCYGYLGDDEANAELFTSDGWMLTGDIVEVDDHGWLSVVGRTSDVIIRGGKNISAAQVEDEVASHPAVAIAAAIAIPDDALGERVCVFAQLRPGFSSLTLGELGSYLADRRVGKELWPERLEVVDELPRSSGGKIAKHELRRLAHEQ